MTTRTAFEPTFESLEQFTCPDGFRDAKFGIWSHWGPQSVGAEATRPTYGPTRSRRAISAGRD